MILFFFIVVLKRLYSLKFVVDGGVFKVSTNWCKQGCKPRDALLSLFSWIFGITTEFDESVTPVGVEVKSLVPDSLKHSAILNATQVVTFKTFLINEQMTELFC